jgi:hypothetical protein
MKKSFGILALAVLGLSFCATTSRADEPVLSSYDRAADLRSGPIAFSDATLAPDASPSREIPIRESFSNADRGFTGHYEWFNRTRRDAVTTPQSVPEPSALLMLLCGCLGLTALSRKLVSYNS